MNGRSKNTISSRRAKKIAESFARDSRLISISEKGNFAKGEMEFIDRTVTVKTLVFAGEEQEILSTQKNKDYKTGINDFQNGRLVSESGGGSVGVDLVKLSYAEYIKDETADDVVNKTFKQTGWSADMENAEIVFLQSGRVVQKIKISEFAFKGDEPNTRTHQYKHFSRPFVIAAGTDLVVKLVRPAGVAGKETYLAIEMQGMQTFPKRTRG